MSKSKFRARFERISATESKRRLGRDVRGVADRVERITARESARRLAERRPFPQTVEYEEAERLVAAARAASGEWAWSDPVNGSECLATKARVLRVADDVQVSVRRYDGAAFMYRAGVRVRPSEDAPPPPSDPVGRDPRARILQAARGGLGLRLSVRDVRALAETLSP